MEFTCNESVPLLLYSTVTGSPAVTRIVVGPIILGGTAPVGGEEVIEMWGEHGRRWTYCSLFWWKTLVTNQCSATH